MDIGNSHNLPSKINKLLVSFGIIILINSGIFTLLYKHSFLLFITHPSNSSIMVAIVLLIIIEMVNLNLLKYIQIIILSMTSILSILSNFNHFFSIGQIIILTILLYKYGFLKTHVKIKMIILSLIYITATEYSLLNSGILGAGIEVFIYVVYFLRFLYILYKAELEKIINENKLSFDSQLDSIQEEKDELIVEVKNKEARIAHLNKLLATQAKGKCCIDMDKYNLTNRQKKVVHILAKENLTNRDIANHFHIKEGTVKSHLYNIYNKIGVSTRNELLGLYYSIDLDI